MRSVHRGVAGPPAAALSDQFSSKPVPVAATVQEASCGFVLLACSTALASHLQRAPPGLMTTIPAPSTGAILHRFQPQAA